MAAGLRRSVGAWLADDAPRMILLHLDGAGPLGDPYQVNSANHGPYGDAVTQELIPHVESDFRGIGRPRARVLDGGSTGGWVSLALQVFYPDFFNGAWSACPDPVDFRAFQLIEHLPGRERLREPLRLRAARRAATSTATSATPMRHECQMENVLGRGDRWTLSGGQWGAWNATYGPRGDDGLPVPLWDRRPARSTAGPPSTGRSTTCGWSWSGTGRRSARSCAASSTSGSATRTTTS